MIVYTLKRLALASLVAVTVSLVSFMLIRVSGDPAISLAGEAASAEQIQHIREQYG
ncbi:MAG: ABC transporter permease, partial [Syntrophobacterales bacterium]